jgi:low-affinity ferrous iron transport protein
MKRIIQAIAAPGAKGAIQGGAPTQYVNVTSTETSKTASVSCENVTGFVAKPKEKLLDRWLDKLVKTSGSEPVFLSIITAVLLWAFMGIRFGKSTDWAIAISNAQAIISYIFDSLLMRQQLNEYDVLMRVAASLRSRNVSHKRMLRTIVRSGQYRAIAPTVDEEMNQTGYSTDLPTENWLGRLSTFVSGVLGHIITICLYWMCILIWIGFGHYCNWSDRWQLYINSSTSALMVLIFAFLANIRERHSAYTKRCFDSLYEVDSALERKLRTITGDSTQNPLVTIPAPKVGKLQRAIFYYADLVGTLVGVAILIVVMVVWVSIGPIMSFNSNWWLLIGTYAGLVGMHDGFVLRNVQNQLDSFADAALETVRFEDMDMLTDIGAPEPTSPYTAEDSLSYRLSVKMSGVCSHEMTVVFGIVAIIGLISGASAMRWTVTGQLLCNVPPSLIESFIMMILITGHNIAEARRRVEFQDMYLRRLKLISYVDRLRADETKQTTSEQGVSHEERQTRNKIEPEAETERLEGLKGTG